MKNKKCIITGANGYLGSFLTTQFKNQGWQVIELSSSKKNTQKEFQLNKSNNLQEVDFKDCNLLIHTSYDFSFKKHNSNNNPNIEGSIKLFEIANRMNVEKIINISTISSFKNSKSRYGKTKFQIEEKSQKYNVINLRPGLFFGSNSKIIKKIENICKIFPIIPMIGKGNFKLHLTNYDDLFQFILEIYSEKNLDFSKILYPCSIEAVTFKELIKLISPSKKTIYTPLYFITIILKLFDLLRIKLPLDYDNLNGLVHYNDEINFDYTRNFKTKFRNFENN